MMDIHTFQRVYGLLVVIAVSIYIGCVGLWHAGGSRKYSPQRKLARRMWQANSFYVLGIFIWSWLSIMQF